ncbi:MAG: ABC transporter ATP-binding protein, partial [Candidatus Izimaplasma sp.]|nr:ABC transporter ATP-binding protein [Candidatus Izimaplasma bacterium]
KNVDLEIMNGEFIVLLGPSGSGKSTMLNIISGLDNPTSGEISIDDEIISDMNSKQLTKFRRDNLGFIFQQYNLLQTLSVKENVEVGREISKLPFTVEEVLEQVGLTSQENKYPFQLSGGEQQRVSIARAVVKNPKIMFCDEPTGALDEKMAKEILGILQKLNKKYKTSVVLITHNPSIGAMADRIIKLNSGEVVEIIVNKNKLKASEISWG